MKYPTQKNYYKTSYSFETRLSYFGAHCLSKSPYSRLILSISISFTRCRRNVKNEKRERIQEKKEVDQIKKKGAGEVLGLIWFTGRTFVLSWLLESSGF